MPLSAVSTTSGKGFRGPGTLVLLTIPACQGLIPIPGVEGHRRVSRSPLKNNNNNNKDLKHRRRLTSEA